MRYLVLITAALCFASAAFGQNAAAMRDKLSAAKVSVAFTETQIGVVLEALGEKAGVPVRLDPEAKREGKPAADLKVSIELNNAPALKAMEIVAEMAGLTVTVSEGLVVLSDRELTPVSWPALPPQVAEALDGPPIAVDFTRDPLGRAMANLSDVAGTEIRAMANVRDNPVTLSARRLTPRQFITLVATLGEYRIMEDAGVVLLNERADADTDPSRRLRKEIVSFAFNEKSAFEAIDFLQVLGKVNIVLDRRQVKPDATVTLKMGRVKLEDAVAAVAGQLKLRYGVILGVVFISDDATLKRLAEPHRDFTADKPGERDVKARKQLADTLVSFSFDDQPAFEAIDFLQITGQLNLVPDRSKFPNPKTTATLKLENASLGTALTLLTGQLGLDWIIRDGVVFITDAATAKKLVGRVHRDFAADDPDDRDFKVGDQLDQTISFTFNEQPVAEALEYIAMLGKLNIVPDRSKFADPKATVTLKVEDASQRMALSLLAEQLGLEWIIREGVVYVSDEATIKKTIGRVHRDFAAERPLDADRRTRQILDAKMVSFTFNEQPWMEAVEFLHTLADPKKTVTLKLDNRPLRTALTLMTEQLGMNWVIKDGAVVLTDIPADK